MRKPPNNEPFKGGTRAPARFHGIKMHTAFIAMFNLISIAVSSYGPPMGEALLLLHKFDKSETWHFLLGMNLSHGNTA